jgi:hypothetical protein
LLTDALRASSRHADSRVPDRQDSLAETVPEDHGPPVAHAGSTAW